jgi:hypothetical protein
MTRSARILLALLALSAGAASVEAGSGYTYWQAEPSIAGDWFDAANWTLGVPTAGNVAVIENGGTAVIDSGTAVAQRTDIGGRALADGGVGGAVIQTGGQAELGFLLMLGHDRGSKGAYTLIGGTLSASLVEVGGYYGSGEFHQIGGIGTVGGDLRIGGLPYNATQDDLHSAGGFYDLSGGQLLTGSTFVGTSGQGAFVQSGGSHQVSRTLTVGGWQPFLVPFPIPGDPSFNLHDLIPLGTPTDPAQGTAQFAVQPAAADGITTNAYIPPPSPSEGRYELSGGHLAAGDLLIQKTGRFTQTGGTAAVEMLSVGPGGRFEYFGGRLNVSAGLVLCGSNGLPGLDGEPVIGTLDFGGARVTLAGGGIMDFSRGRILGADLATVTAGPDSLVIVAPGFDPAAEFGRFVSQGLVHVAGSDLVLGEGQGFSGRGTISDHVETSGWIAATPGGGINLDQGVTIHGGQVDLGSGCLTVQDDRSGISAGRLNAGSVTVGGIIILTYGEPYTPPPPPLFRQTGGDVSFTDTAQVSGGSYAMYGGTLTARGLDVGGEWSSNHDAEFLQAGGTVSVSTLRVARLMSVIFRNDSGTEAVSRANSSIFAAGVSGSGDLTYRMQAGRLSVGSLEIEGGASTSSFVQTGGEVLAQRVSIVGGDASYVLSGGRLTARQLELGDRLYYSGATLAILSPAAEVFVSDQLAFGHKTSFVAVPGATIHITGPTSDPAMLYPAGATVSIWSTDPAAMSGLGNLKLVFEGGLDYAATLEVAGQDRGPGYAGFFENFALDTLQIGGAEPARVQLVDLFDNHPDLPGREALYVKTLIIEPGSSLDLNGLTIYYLAADIAPGTSFTNGSVLPIPEPATLALLALSAAWALRRRCKRSGG